MDEKPMVTNEYESSWEWTKAQSAYHFDPTIMDPRWDTAVGLGHITPCWEAELKEIIANSKPATWANRGYKGEGVEVPPEDLEAEENDLRRAGVDPSHVITNLSWKMPTVLQKISDAFGMIDTMNRIHVQLPGQTFNLHMDKLWKWAPDNPDSILRVMIQLTDWQPGQFWEYGNFHWNKWRAGDVTTFDWRNVPHSTANAGHHPRVTLQVTGVKTDATEKFLEKLRNTKSYTL